VGAPSEPPLLGWEFTNTGCPTSARFSQMWDTTLFDPEFCECPISASRWQMWDTTSVGSNR